MRREPAFYVRIEGQDLPFPLHVRSFEFSGSDKKQDRLSIAWDAVPVEAVDHPLLQEGLKLEARWGYLDGEMSDKVILKIKEVTPKFGSSVSLTLLAYSKEHKAKGRTAKNVWSKKKDSDIVKDVAKALGFKPDVDDLPIVRECFQQAARDYYEVLSDLARRNNCVWWEQNGTLSFKREDKLMLQDPVGGYEYRSGAGPLLSFEPKNRSEDKGRKGPGRQAQHAGANIKRKRPIVKKAHDGNNPSRVALAPRTWLNIDISGPQTKVTRVTEPTTTKKVSKSRYDKRRGETPHSKASTQQDPRALRHEARAANARAAHRELQASADFIGLPRLREKTKITITGVGKKHSGNWYVQGVRHVIDSGGYRTSAELVRGGAHYPKTSGVKTQSQVPAEQATPDKPGQRNNSRTQTVDVVPAGSGPTRRVTIKIPKR